MSYALRNDGKSWRSVNGPDEVGPDEWYSEGPQPDPVQLTAEELAIEAKEKRNRLLAAAASRMGPLQDAVEINRATDEEASRLVLWKGYRIDLNRIETQEGFPLDIQWPLSPDDNALQGVTQ